MSESNRHTPPSSELLECAPDRCRRPAARLLVKRENPQLVAVDLQVRARDEALAVEDRQHVVAPEAFWWRYVDLETMVEAEELGGAGAVAEDVVERGEGGRPPAWPEI